MARAVTVLTTGGTIAMEGDGGAVPALDAERLTQGLEVAARSLVNKPSVQLTSEDVLLAARTAAAECAAGRGVVVTCGTDCIEEVAVVIDLMTDGPVVVTGAIRPSGTAGADGPANLRDAIAVAAALGRGTVVCFGGELHAAREVRKSDSTSPRAFSSPRSGPLGRVDEGEVTLHRAAPTAVSLPVEHLDARVHIASAALAADGSAVEALAAVSDALVAVVLGAGHTPPAFLAAMREAAQRMPVVATVRPERGQILRATYGFEGAEPDLHASGAVVAGHLSAAAARMALLAWLGTAKGRPELTAVLA
jgi:L-asparaginase